MKLPTIALTVALVSSSIAPAAPAALDLQRSSPSFSGQEVLLVEDGLLEAAVGGFNRGFCIGATIGFGPLLSH